MVKLSVVILTKNEEKNILDCLESLSEISEIVVIDDYSEDRTLEVIKTLNFKTVKIFKRKLDGNFSSQRNFGLEKAKNNWVLFIDADERLSSNLIDEVKERINSTDYNGFFVKRSDVLWGKKLKHGETGNIKLVRLGGKESGKWSGDVHEVWNIKGRIGELKHELTHYPHQTTAEFLKEIDFYSTLRARELKNKGVTSSVFSIVLYTKAKFIQNYILKLGFLDGIEGLVFALFMSLHSFLVRSKLFLLWRNEM